MEMPLIYPSAHVLHDPAAEFIDGVLQEYTECPRRVEIVRDWLLEAGIATLHEPDWLVARDELAETHDPDMLAFLERASASVPEGDGYLYASVFAIRPEMARLAANPDSPYGSYCFDADTPIGRGTWRAALSSATAAAAGAALLVEDGLRCAYALCRPPGHHAGSDFAGGYCYLNNAAVAARRLRGLGKVAIVDIDYHHGNGTQEIFWDEPTVFFGSIHGDPSFAYPYCAGYADELGGPRAVGSNMNIPLPAGTDGDVYLSALDRMLGRVLDFSPGALVVSVGYDTFIGDPLSSFQLDTRDYQRIGSLLAQGGLPTLFVQEGGYSLEALGVLAESLLSGFLAG